MLSLRRSKRGADPPKKKKSSHCKGCHAPLFSLVPGLPTAVSSPAHHQSSPPLPSSPVTLTLPPPVSFSQEPVSIVNAAAVSPTPVSAKINSGTTQRSAFEEDRSPFADGLALIEEASSAYNTPENASVTKSPLVAAAEATSISRLDGSVPVDSSTLNENTGYYYRTSDVTVASDGAATPTSKSVAGSQNPIRRIRNGIQAAGANRYRHYCRSCGHAFCIKCASRRVSIPQYGYVFPVRICNSCLDKLRAEDAAAMKQVSPAVGVIFTGSAKVQNPLGNWRRRLLVLTNNALHFFRPQNGTLMGEERGSVLLQQIHEVIQGPSHGRSHIFVVRSAEKGQRYNISVPTLEQRDEWISSINKAKEGSARVTFWNMCPDPELNIVPDLHIELITKGPMQASTSSLSSGIGDTVLAFASDVKFKLDISLEQGQCMRVFFTKGFLASISYQDLVDLNCSSPTKGNQAPILSSLRIPLVVRANTSRTMAATAAKLSAHGKVPEESKQCDAVFEVQLLSEGPSVPLLSALRKSKRSSVLKMTVVAVVVCLVTLALGQSLVALFAPVLAVGMYLVSAPGARNSEMTWKISLIEVIARSSSEAESQLAMDELPARFLHGSQGDRVEATRRFKIHQQWRKTYNIESILTTPQPYYDIIKQCYPSYIHGRDKHGYPVAYENAGDMRTCFEKLRAENVPLESLLLHYAFVQEYLWSKVDPRPWPDGRLTKVMDLKGVSFSDLAGPLFEFVKTLSAFVGPNYPERLAVVFIINVPTWFNVLWKMMTPLVHPITRAKTKIFRGGYEKTLQEFVDISQIPSEYGGSCECPGGCASGWHEEREMSAYVKKLNAEYKEERDRLSSSGEDSDGERVTDDLSSNEQR